MEAPMALTGTEGDDRFKGTIFAEEIYGFGGEDEIDGSPGADRIDGGEDTDSISYTLFVVGIPGATAVQVIDGKAVDVDLERATQFGGFAEGDVLIGVENVLGSKEDDVIKGDAEANRLT